MADFLKNNWLFRKFYGPAGQQLTTDTTFSEMLGPVNYELGVLAGSASLDPFSSLIIPADYDGKVSIESTKVEGMTDHLIVHATHMFFPRNKTVLRQTEHFLKHGFFKR